MVSLPIEFEKRMRDMLGEEFDAFLESYERPARKGLRLNRLKISTEEFENSGIFQVKKVPWVENGYFFDETQMPSRHPYYAAGVYYLQEPSAMTPASRLEILPGDRVLDLCAAPGGKATELAARLKGQGLLVANEISNSRAKALLRNLELFGARNCFVTNEEPAHLSARFEGFFNKILVDAPCSGEGMFHKKEDVISTWSQERVKYFANLQKNILEEAEKMLQPGGLLMYSTCTFSPEENEQSIAGFMEKHPEMHLMEIEAYDGFRPGNPLWADPVWAEKKADPAAAEELAQKYQDLRKCVRIWPHHMDGEGHFLALLYKEAYPGAIIPEGNSPQSAGVDSGNTMDQDERLTHDKDRGRRLGKERRRAGRKDNFRKAGRTDNGRKGGKNPAESDGIGLCMEFMQSMGISLDPESLECRGDKVYMVSHRLPSVSGLHFLRNGVYVGDIKKNRFEPSQPFALILNSQSCKEYIDLQADDPDLALYMSGGTVVFEDQEKEISNGWKLVCVDGFGMGWGKYVQGLLKNKYPISWRAN